jgi:hypothetical protein
VRSRIAILFLAIAVIARCATIACAKPFRYDSLRRGQAELAIMGGYGGNHRIPSGVRDTSSLELVKARYGWFTSPRSEIALDFAYERPNTPVVNNTFTGTISYRRHFLVRGSTALAFEIGGGFCRLERKNDLLGTKTNLTETIGLAFHHGLGPASALIVDYTFAHTSNANTGYPNVGINASTIGIGISYYR